GSGTHGHEYAELTRNDTTFRGQPFVREKERTARQVSVVSEHTCRVTHIVARQAKVHANRVDHLLPTGMHYPVGYVGTPQTGSLNESLEGDFGMPSHHIRDFGIEIETVFSMRIVPLVAHRVNRFRDDAAGEPQQRRPGSRILLVRILGRAHRDSG